MKMEKDMDMDRKTIGNRKGNLEQMGILMNNRRTRGIKLEHN
jgi:hypothetical protein